MRSYDRQRETPFGYTLAGLVLADVTHIFTKYFHLSASSSAPSSARLLGGGRCTCIRAAGRHVVRKRGAMASCWAGCVCERVLFVCATVARTRLVRTVLCLCPLELHKVGHSPLPTTCRARCRDSYWTHCATQNRIHQPCTALAKPPKRLA